MHIEITKCKSFLGMPPYNTQNSLLLYISTPQKDLKFGILAH